MSLPIQPLELDDSKVLRFRANNIVRALLEQDGGLTMNDIAVMGFSQEDQEQFAQLIGYSLSGYGDLPYVTDETYETAEKMFEDGLTADKARIKVLQTKLGNVREYVKGLVPVIFRNHPDDLVE